MSASHFLRWFVLLGSIFILSACERKAGSERLEKFRPAKEDSLEVQTIETPGQFSGYTNYWHSIFWVWHSYGNLYQISHADVARSILQNKVDIAEELGVPGLALQEGFLSLLIGSSFVELEDPSEDVLSRALAASDVMISVDSLSELGKKLLARLPSSLSRRHELDSHQMRGRDFHDVYAYWLENRTRKLFVLASDCRECRLRTGGLIKNVVESVRAFDFHRGWFGVGTMLHSVTCHPGHPLELIGQGLNQGNDWFTFSGYMDYLLQKELPEWLAKVNLDIVTDVGTAKATHSFGSFAYGCRDWGGLKIQDMPTEKEWIQYVKERGGFIFRPVFSPECDPFPYDGYIAIEGNKKQIDEEDVPFILQTGYVREEAPPAMVLFLSRGDPLTRERLWEAILARRAVGVLPQGKMMGPKRFRSVLQMLLLDRVFLENYFGDRIQLEAKVEGYELKVKLRNSTPKEVAGNLEIVAAPELEVRGGVARPVQLAGISAQALSFRLQPSLKAMGQTNPILVVFRWHSGQKRTLAIMDLPPVISIHRLLYGQSPEIVYPVSIHNFSPFSTFSVELKVEEADHPERMVYQTELEAHIPPGKFAELIFRLPLPPGSFEVEVSALGDRAVSQLGVEAGQGNPRAYEVDLNGDGISEYRLENEKVLVTLLTTGARIIEYIVKEKGDNVLFKLWPEKEGSTDKRPFRERGFYPYGGFEDFLGQASMETHKVYEAELSQKTGPCVQVRMWADFYGNQLEKVFTLYGDSPLVEVRFALIFRNPEANRIGPQPILELGRRHGTEDVFVVPSISGRREFRMRPEEYFGEVIFLEEGWNAGCDPLENVAFVGAFPVSEPEFLHLWMNHPANPESHHYYAEFQPWVPIFQKTVRYFSYYLWGSPGGWEKALTELRRRNLIQSQKPFGSSSSDKAPLD
ncbi:MAG: hypothetical protein ACUVV5_01735 [Candidatus Aminicenantales bacterium]